LLLAAAAACRAGVRELEEDVPQAYAGLSDLDQPRAGCCEEAGELALGCGAVVDLGDELARLFFADVADPRG
jgi:hypothetical protein